MTAEELSFLLFGAYEVYKVIKPVITDVLPAGKTLWDKLKSYRHRSQVCNELFLAFFSSLDAKEQKLITELILNGTAQRDLNTFSLEGSAGLRTYTFECVANYSWEMAHTLQEEQGKATLPIQVARRNGAWKEDLRYHFDGYNFLLLPEYRKHWKRLYKKLPHYLRKVGQE